MNRRNFFKVVAGFVAGIFAVPKAKAKVSDEKIDLTREMYANSINDMERDADKLSSEIIQANAELDGKIKLELRLGCKEFRDALNEVVEDKLHCYICYEDCPLFLQCHGQDFYVAGEEYHSIFSPLIKRTKELLRERGIV